MMLRLIRGFEGVAGQLEEYLAGTRTLFDLPLEPRGTEFQLRVWELITQIPYGQTTTYGDLARRLGGRENAEEVGAAVGRNPLCILIPCHRVIGSNGKLAGYAGGLKRKQKLLELEHAEGGAEHLDEPVQFRSSMGLRRLAGSRVAGERRLGYPG